MALQGRFKIMDNRVNGKRMPARHQDLKPITKFPPKITPQQSIKRWSQADLDVLPMWKAELLLGPLPHASRYMNIEGRQLLLEYFPGSSTFETMWILWLDPKPEGGLGFEISPPKEGRL